MNELNTLPISNADAIVAADSLAYISITGDDAASFLQGQLTVDTPSMVSGDIRYTAQCDAKGKMTGLGFLCRNDQGFVFIQDKATIGASLAQLQKFGVFAKAEFVLSDNELTALAFYQDSEVASENATVVSPPLPSLNGLRLAWFTPQHAPQRTHSNAVLSALFIQAGVGLLKTDMAEQWVPQMLNVQALNGIDFDKGCYMGQEVVARTRYLGKNKRAMYSFTAPIDAIADELVIGAAIFRQLGENWRKSGTVLDYAILDDRVFIAAVLPNDVAEQDVITLAENSDGPLTHQALPYVIESETSSVKQRKRND